MLSLVYGMRSKVDCMDFVMMDRRNAEMADQPPNGLASPQTLMHAPMRMGVFIGELAEYELTTVAVMCGQGLTLHVPRVEMAPQEGHGNMHPPIDPAVIVYAAATTGGGGGGGGGGGESHVLGTDPDLAMRASVARLGF